MIEDQKLNRNKVGLALGGGSALGSAHIGVIKAFRENDIPIDFVSGTSAGAVVAVALAFDVSLDKMIEISKKMSWKNISKFGYSKMGLNSNEPVGKIVEEMIGKKKIENARIPLAIIATNIDTGEKVVFKTGSVAKAVMASSCIPGFYAPVEINGKKFVDGGLTENVPLSVIQEMGAEIKIGVDLEGWEKFKKTKNILDVISNSYDILIKPQSMFAAESADFIIKPHLERFTSSDFDEFKNIMQAGYRAATLASPEIRKRLNKKTSVFESFIRKIIRLLSFWKK